MKKTFHSWQVKGDDCVSKSRCERLIFLPSDDNINMLAIPWGIFNKDRNIDNATREMQTHVLIM